MEHSTNNKRIAKNTLFLYFRMLITMGVSLYTSRVVLNALGVENFGIYNVVGGVVVLFSFLNNAMSTASQRFLSFELGKNDTNELKRVFSMSMTAHISIVLLVLLLAETVGLWFLNTQINIPDGKMNDANLVYQCSILTTCIGIIQVPYHASIIAYEKMSFFAYISIIEVTFKLAVAFLIIYINFDTLKIYSVLICLVSFCMLLLYRFYCKRKIDVCSYNFFWNSKLYKSLMSFSGWSLFGSVAVVGANQGVNMLLNIFYGVVVNAAMGIANQVNGAFNSFVSNFQTAFKPQIVKFYAVGDKKKLEQLIFRSSRFSFLLLFTLTVPIMLNIDFLLKIWLKTVPEYADVFCNLTIIASLLETLSAPLWITMQATGRIKKYQICISTVIGLNPLFAYFFLKNGFSPVVVLMVKIPIDVVCLAIRLLFVQSNINVKIFSFVKNVLYRVVLIVLIVLPLPYLLSKHYIGWIGLFLTSLSFLFLVFLVIYFIGFTKPERNAVNRLIYHRLSVKSKK
jgi:O-antigen/teichoic acid export membrane protein